MINNGAVKQVIFKEFKNKFKQNSKRPLKWSPSIKFNTINKLAITKLTNGPEAKTNMRSLTSFALKHSKAIKLSLKSNISFNQTGENTGEQMIVSPSIL